MSPPPGSAPPMGTVHRAPPPSSPMAHALSRPHAAAGTLLPDDDGSDSESVAESSCPGPYSRRPTESGFLSSGGFRCDDEDEDDGCSSCVEGNDRGYQEADEEEEVSTASAWWWKKRVVAGDGCAFPPADQAREEAEEDPERAAARQAEDRKFWEDCLGTGYP